MDLRKKIAIIVAGGSGTRMGHDTPKQFLPLYGQPLLYHTLRVFLQAYDDIRIRLVLPVQHFSCGEQLSASLHMPDMELVAGGETRFHSVQNGLCGIDEPSVIFVHDGVRPLLSTRLIQRCYEQALQNGSAVPAIPLKDSIREVKGDSNRSADRSSYRIIQTPQTFRSEILLPAFAQAFDPQFTDEATVVERSGHPVHLIEGEEENIKITRPLDMLIAEKILEERMRNGK
jgi:2-C-methyl-D-erythritol 4-phosphate cytidylyltransferase